MGKSKDREVKAQHPQEAARQIQQERALIKAEFRNLFDSVSEILFRNDPIEINFKSNTDEYEPEVGTILPRLQSCSTTLDVRRMIHEEFLHWFGADIAGPEEKYEIIAGEVLAAWQRWKETPLP